MPKFINFRFPEGWYFLHCDSTELKRFSKIIFSVSERHRWAVLGWLRSLPKSFIEEIRCSMFSLPKTRRTSANKMTSPSAPPTAVDSDNGNTRDRNNSCLDLYAATGSGAPQRPLPAFAPTYSPRSGSSRGRAPPARSGGLLRGSGGGGVVGGRVVGAGSGGEQRAPAGQPCAADAVITAVRNLISSR